MDTHQADIQKKETGECPPLVSIITPYYNTGEVFLDTVKCVLSQTLVDFEWIIVDDASTVPASVKTLESCTGGLRAQNIDVRILRHEKNKGLSAARNTGILAARSEFIMLLDSDDILEPTCVEKSYWYLMTHPECAFVGTHTVGFGAQNYLWEKGFHHNEEFLKENLTVPNVMVRRAVALEVGGFDESRKKGLEDWDFWLKCAAAGFWGGVIPEFLNRYRRREFHTDYWADYCDAGTGKFREELPRRYPGLTDRTFPRPAHAWHMPNQAVATDIPPTAKQTYKGCKCFLMIVPHFQMGGADKWNLDFVSYLKTEGWAVTLVATNKAGNWWLKQFQEVTNDIHILHNYVPPADFPRCIRYLMATRQPDVVCISNSQLGYALLPFLRACFPRIPFVDYIHMEEENWRSGGYAMDSVRHRNSLALTGVSSDHLKNWMAVRGKTEDSIRTVYINIDVSLWMKRPEAAPGQRAALGIPDGHAVILYACRLEEQKQPDVFAATVELLLKEKSDAFFIIAGDGKFADRMARLQRKHPRNVKWLGAVENERIKDILNIADIFFLPSMMEGIALTFYEAMAMGVIPVGADVGGQAELVTPDCGILIESLPKERQPAKYAGELLRLLSDAGRMAAMKMRAQARVKEHFPLRRMGEAMLSLFGEAGVKNEALPVMPIGVAESYAGEIIEQFRLADLAEGLWAKRNEHTFNEQFRNSFISPKFSRTKRNILRFLMKHL
jgi:glycosyltransferase involved in cell wall biosynthesis